MDHEKDHSALARRTLDLSSADLGLKVATFPGSIFLRTSVSSSPSCSGVCTGSHGTLCAKPGY